jgi:glutamyl-tRNA synthetase
MSLGDLRESGLEPMALNSLLAKLGSSDAIAPRHSLAELLEEFDMAHYSRATPKFDDHEMEHLNARLLHEMPFNEAAPRLVQAGIPGDEAFWLAVRPNLKRFSEARDWWHIVGEAVTPVVEDPGFLSTAAGLLPPAPWSVETWKAWTSAVQQATGRKGKELFHPLRLALTGRENGPELKTLLPLIGPDRAAARLRGQTA